MYQWAFPEIFRGHTQPWHFISFFTTPWNYTPFFLRPDYYFYSVKGSSNLISLIQQSCLKLQKLVTLDRLSKDICNTVDTNLSAFVKESRNLIQQPCLKPQKLGNTTLKRPSKDICTLHDISTS